MSESAWKRFGYWLEKFQLGRIIVLRREQSYPQDTPETRRYSNRINGHYVVTGFSRPSE